MKKIEIRIKNAKKKLEKLSKNNYYESSDLQGLANLLETKVNETLKEISDINELKNSLEIKNKKLNDSKSEIKKKTNELVELSIKTAKELEKRKNDEKKEIVKKEKLESDKPNKKGKTK